MKEKIEINRRKLIGQLGAAIAASAVAAPVAASASIAAKAVKVKGVNPTIKSLSITFVSIDSTPLTVQITLTPKGTSPVTGWLFTAVINSQATNFTLSPPDFADFANFVNVINNNP